MLRSIRQADLPQLLIMEELTQEAPWTAETFEHCWNSGYVGWVEEREDRVTGFVIVSEQNGENHILNLCVHPDFQHQGIGRKLVEYVLETAKNNGAGTSFLEVRRSNAKAISLYEKLGFVQIGERKGYYPAAKGREDALVFAKDLSVQ